MKYSDQPQILKVFNYLSDTGEYIGASDAYIAPNTGLPAFCSDVEPPLPAVGEIAIFHNEKWSVVTDMRGHIAEHVNLI